MKSHGLTGVFENLQKKGFTSADAMRSLETRAVAAFSAINNNLGTIKSFESQMLLSDAATAGANKQMESFANTWSKFVSTLSSAAYTGFKPILTLLQGMTSGLASLFAGLEKIPGALQAVTTALVALAGSAALSSLVGTLRNFSLIGGAITGLGTLATLFTGLSGAFGTITTLTAVISTLGIALLRPCAHPCRCVRHGDHPPDRRVLRPEGSPARRRGAARQGQRQDQRGEGPLRPDQDDDHLARRSDREALSP